MTSTKTTYAEIYLSYNEIEAGLIRELLEGEGISTVIRDMRITPYPINIGKFAEKRIAVPEGKAAEARELLRQALADGFLSEEEGKFKE